MFKFNLQHHAEEAAPVVPSATDVAQPTPVEAAPIEQKKSFSEMSTKEQVDFFQQQYHSKETPPVAPTIAQEEAKVVPVVETPTPQEIPVVQPYTPEEISSIGIDKLDPKRLPEALQPYYKSMLADYTRKTQAVAEQRKQAEIPPIPQPEQAKPKTFERLTQEYNQDLQIVEQILNEGNGGERIEYNAYDPAHVYVMKRVSDYRVMQEQQQNSIVQSNAKMIQQVQTDPDYAAVMALAEKEVVALSGTSFEGMVMAQKILQANERLNRHQATSEDIDMLQTFWNTTKTKHQASKIKPAAPVIPPPKAPIITEKTGPSVPTEPKAKGFKPSDVKKMSTDQQKELFGAFVMSTNKK